MNRSLQCVAVLLLLLSARAVLADVVFFTDRPSFSSSGPNTMMYEGFNVPFPSHDPNVWFPTGGPPLFQVSENSNSPHVVSTFDVPSPNLFISEGVGAIRFSVNPSSFEFIFSEPITAFGVDVTDIDPDFGITVNDDYGNSFNLTVPIAGQTTAYNQFFGIVNTQPFSSVTIDVSRSTHGFSQSSGLGFLGFDWVQFGLANPINTPEPGAIATWIAALLALPGVWFFRRFRQRPVAV